MPQKPKARPLKPKYADTNIPGTTSITTDYNRNWVFTVDTVQPERPKPSPTSKRIFLVHGHDNEAVQETARFLEKLGQEVIILREQPNKGRTIIEKFEDYGDVGFAVVSLTPDDKGGTKDTPCDKLKPRARQNVMFELGYFIGRLGRKNVCALYKQGVELPSDYSGVAYVEMDDKKVWRFELAKELKAAGFAVDMNKAL